MLREEVLKEWKKVKNKFQILASKSIDKFKDKEIRSIHKVELESDTYGVGSTCWTGEILFVKGLWVNEVRPYTQKVTIHFEVQKLSEILELVEDQTAEDRKFLRRKENGTFVDSDGFSETNLTDYRNISGDGPTIEEVE